MLIVLSYITLCICVTYCKFRMYVRNILPFTCVRDVILWIEDVQRHNLGDIALEDDVT